MRHIDLRKLKGELARQGATLTSLARKMKMPVSTLSSWLHRVHIPPDDFIPRVEKTLGVPSDSLTTNE